ncbi:hypothetical protein ACOSP7_031240 [Xanthoceras sorbifolium]
MFWGLLLDLKNFPCVKNERNACLHNGRSRKAIDILDWSANFLAESQNTQLALKPKAQVGVSSSPIWESPPSAVNDKSNFLGFASHIIYDINALRLSGGAVPCKAIPRIRNCVAHALASLAVSSLEDHLWLDDEPSYISSLL